MSLVTVLFLLLLPVFSVALDIGGPELIATTFAYRKKPNTPNEDHCFQGIDVICERSATYCGAFHVGQNFYTTPAHCLVGIDGIIQKPNELDIVGVGKVKVTIALHHEFANLTGRDVAWIHYNQTKDVPTVRVAEVLPNKCKHLKLEIFDTASRGIHSGIRWTEVTTGKRIYEINDTTGTSKKFTDIGYALFENEARAENFHLVLCNTQWSEVYDVHYVQIARFQDYLVTLDCHYVQCGNVTSENMIIPSTITTNPSSGSNVNEDSAKPNTKKPKPRPKFDSGTVSPLKYSDFQRMESRPPWAGWSTGSNAQKLGENVPGDLKNEPMNTSPQTSVPEIARYDDWFNMETVADIDEEVNEQIDAYAEISNGDERLNDETFAKYDEEIEEQFEPSAAITKDDEKFSDNIFRSIDEEEDEHYDSFTDTVKDDERLNTNTSTEYPEAVDELFYQYVDAADENTAESLEEERGQEGSLPESIIVQQKVEQQEYQIPYFKNLQNTIHPMAANALIPTGKKTHQRNKFKNNLCSTNSRYCNTYRQRCSLNAAPIRVDNYNVQQTSKSHLQEVDQDLTPPEESQQNIQTVVPYAAVKCKKDPKPSATSPTKARIDKFARVQVEVPTVVIRSSPSSAVTIDERAAIIQTLFCALFAIVLAY
ncbi:uncharacterized protein LOC110678873 [Aedes aegypti]|uniref:Peptidase S1 domain-containing protein n=1 Tax=Aedes aegypti TaxID=7159 RepID=A0A6I8TZ04_AEDAE|nr:uncharacterized protein LOC110678873 [Aedes aegypti]